MGKEFRVFGPPGTGKTTYLSRQIKRASKKHGSHTILVASFTKTASEELTTKNLPLDDRQIGTLHAHCYRALNYPEIAETRILNFNQFAPNYSLSMDKSDIDSPNLMETATTEGDKLMMEYQTLRAKMVDRDLWPISVKNFANKWETFKKRNHLVDFTDMISIALEEVDIPLGDPKIGFFDEAQDFTPLELALVRKWCENMDWIIVAGDDDQNLYSFKGATPEGFINPPLPEDQVIILDQSWRVPRVVQEYAERWIEQIKVRQPKKYKPKEDAEGELRHVDFGNWKDPGPLLNDAQKYMDEGKKVMFLTTCGYMLEPLKSLLRKEGLPFYNPYRKKRGDWNPLHATRGTSSTERLLAFFRNSNEVYGSQAEMWNWDELNKWVQLISSRENLQHGVKKFIPEIITELKEEGDFGHLEPVTIDELLEIFTEDALEKALANDLKWFDEALLTSKASGMQFPLQVARKHGASKLTEVPQIIIGTIHSVKGGEADVVYLFPDLSTAGMREWINESQKDNIIRQFYVGMTRTKEVLITCPPASNYKVELGGI